MKRTVLRDYLCSTRPATNSTYRSSPALVGSLCDGDLLTHIRHGDAYEAPQYIWDRPSFARIQLYRWNNARIHAPSHRPSRKHNYEVPLARQNCRLPEVLGGTPPPRPPPPALIHPPFPSMRTDMTPPPPSPHDRVPLST